MTAAALSRPHRFGALDGLRGVAAVSVLLYHAGQWIGTASMARHGYLAVDLFFCLSGFVLASAYDAPLRSGMRPFEFMRRRIIRLWPLLAISMLLGAAFQPKP